MKKSLLLLLLTLPVAFASLAQSKVTQTREVANFNSVELRMPATVYVSQGDHYSVTVTATQEWLDRIYTEVDGKDLAIGIEDNSRSKDYWKANTDVIVNITMQLVSGLQVVGSGAIKSENSILTDQLTLDVRGSGSISVNEFKSGKASQSVYGSGVISVNNGVAESISQEVQGSGAIRSKSLNGTMISILLGGSGEVKIEEVKAQRLDASAEGSGNIRIAKGIVTDLSVTMAGSGGISATEVVGKNVSAQVAGSGNIGVGVLDLLEATIAGSGSIVYKGSPSTLHKNIAGSGSVRQQ